MMTTSPSLQVAIQNTSHYRIIRCKVSKNFEIWCMHRILTKGTKSSNVAFMSFVVHKIFVFEVSLTNSKVGLK